MRTIFCMALYLSLVHEKVERCSWGVNLCCRHSSYFILRRVPGNITDLKIQRSLGVAVGGSSQVLGTVLAVVMTWYLSCP